MVSVEIVIYGYIPYLLVNICRFSALMIGSTVSLYVSDNVPEYIVSQHRNINLQTFTFSFADRDSSVGIETLYGLDGPGIRARWKRDFLYPFRLDLGPTQPPVQWAQGFFSGGKAA